MIMNATFNIQDLERLQLKEMQVLPVCKCKRTIPIVEICDI